MKMKLKMWRLSEAPGIKLENQNLPPLNKKAFDHLLICVLFIYGSHYFELYIIKVKDADKTNIG